jgi:hypothetical protein
MKTLHRFCALLVVAAAGCGGLSVPQPQSSSEMLRSIGAIHAISALTPARIVLPIHRTVGKSWIRPGAVKQWLLYASDFYEGVVDVYDYRSKKGDLEGQITGFTFPGPQCVDSSGNVYVTDGGTWNIYEFAHGATSPSQTVHDQYGNPNGCSVDPRTGDLAVANVNGNGGSYSPGGIVIFAGGIGGVQTNYTNNAISGVWPPGYDSRGNLFFEYSGNAGSGAGELPDGSNQIRILSGMKIGFPGAVQWDGSRVAMSDQEYEGRNYEAIYRVKISGTKVHAETPTC